ncbi:hypothetical protein DSO57_1001796 [Entomophthora muscae]|uniref:Uncharacterized protein n=1 Tax=Entomophthora muscae TaxID=34485 RepID=A0ACC2U7M8_9FUNG|nr:hypothetical protein DSO57_1001796 [Entomophthora muscae]
MSPIAELAPSQRPSAELVFFINHKLHRLKDPDPQQTTLSYLRNQGLTGTKLGCGEGGCGACTVVIASLDGNNKVRHLTANACLLPLCLLHGKQIITIEGLGCPAKPHAIQERLALGHGSQCGFCTPGIVMSMYGLLQASKEPSIQDIEDSFEGNLCRCTGYRPILESFKTFAKDNQDATCQNKILEKPVDEHCNIVYSHNSIKTDCSTKNPKVVAACTIPDLALKVPYHSEQDVSFPKALMGDLSQLTLEPLYFRSADCHWFRPTQLQELLVIKSKYPEAKLVGGSSEIGIEMRLKSMNFRHFVDVSRIPELCQVVWKKSAMIIGVNITLTDFIHSLETQLLVVEPFQKPTLKAFLTNLRWFAGRQIRNFATVGGNIATGSPISDLNPIFIATQAVLTLVSRKGGTREVKMSEFFKGYRQIDLKQDEVILTVKVPLAKPGQFVRAYKQARRKDDDIAIVNAAFCVQLDIASQPPTISSIEMAFGGMGPTTLRLAVTPQIACGLEWGLLSNLDRITCALLAELELPFSVVGGMASYRRTLAASFFKRFWLQLTRDLNMESSLPLHNLDDMEQGTTQATQSFGPAANHDALADPLISRTYPHLSALVHCTGAASYTDDIPAAALELHAAPVFSTQAHAEILEVDPKQALALYGVHQFISHKDVPGHNTWGIIAQDEEFFASREVHCVGQLIGLVLADTHELARRAADLVKVKYQPLEFILTIQEAIQTNSFFPIERKLTKGDFTEDAFCGEDVVVISGECHVGGQEHFYLETQGCLAIPKGENGEMELICSSQNITESQMETARALNFPANRITAKAKRLGGGFGGKETRASVVAVVAAVAAHASGRPVRYILDRDMDMLSSGNRHPYLGKYRLAVSRGGRFKAMDLELIANAGWTHDVSHAVLERAVTHCDNVYHFPILRVVGRLAKTNISTNTAFRGFGGPQGMLVTEMMIATAADTLGIDPATLRHINFYEEGQLTHYKMPVLDWYIPEMWDTLLASTNYAQRLKEINAFNANNPWRKRGIAAIPTKFSVSFGIHFLNQAGATILIYTDGSVLLSHGGVDIGQGLHTKMVQLCANALKVPLHNVHVTETSTDKVANTSATAASASSDLNGMAVLDACRQLNERLQPYWDKAPPGSTLADVAQAAYLDMVNLSASGFYKAPTTKFDWEKGEGNMYLYSTSGVAVTEVEVDVLTGDHVVKAADILMDVGNSINFAIDLGQIEGAFVQGMGWCTTEETLFATQSGRRVTLGPGSYKIPGFRSALRSSM